MSDFTHTITYNWSDGQRSLSGSVAESFDAEESRNITLASNATDIEVDIDFVYSRLKSFYCLATKNLTIETNANNASGGDTITVVANKPYVWQDSSGVTCPFANNVVKMFLTNGAAAENLVQMRFGYDSTP